MSCLLVTNQTKLTEKKRKVKLTWWFFLSKNDRWCESWAVTFCFFFQPPAFVWNYSFEFRNHWESTVCGAWFYTCAYTVQECYFCFFGKRCVKPFMVWESAVCHYHESVLVGGKVEIWGSLKMRFSGRVAHALRLCDFHVWILDNVRRIRSRLSPELSFSTCSTQSENVGVVTYWKFSVWVWAKAGETWIWMSAWPAARLNDLLVD